MIKARIDVSDLRAATKALKRGPYRRAMRKAGSEAIRKMKTEASRRIRERINVKDRTIKRAMVVVRPKGSLALHRLQWGFHFLDTRIPLGDAKPRQTKLGVTAEVFKGERKLHRGVFRATMPSGHKGVFKRKGATRLKIRELVSFPISNALLKPGQAEAVVALGRHTFRKAFKRLLPLERKK